MLRYNILFFLLFILLVMGAFASMAQNAYGMDVLAIVAFTFSGIFVLRFLTNLISRKKDLLIPLEWAAMAILSLVLGLRIYYIWFEGVEVVFGVAGLILIVLYGVKLRRSYRSLQPESVVLARLIMAFYLSIICYTLSMTITPFIPMLGEPLGALGFLFFIILIIGNYRFGQFTIKEERVSTIQFVGRFKDGSVILATLFVIFTAYMGLTKLDLLPTLYSNQYPKAYYQLVSNAESGLEAPGNGTFRHELFKDRYESFINRNQSSINE